MLFLYEEDSERIFSDVVLDANLTDFSLANAFLLGIDLRSLCTLDELVVVREFVNAIRDEAKSAWPAFVRAEPNAGESAEEQARRAIAAPGDNDRLTSQFGVVPLFDGGIKGLSRR